MRSLASRIGPAASTGGGYRASQRPAVLRRDWAGRILAWNSGCERLFGIPANQARGRPVDELLGRSLPAPSRAAIEAALLQEGSWSGEIWHRLADGRNLVLAAHWRLEPATEPGLPGPWVTETLIDLTGARATAEPAAGTTAPPLLGFVCDEAGRTLHLDRGFRRFTGLPGEALPGEDWLAALHPEDREQAASLWALRQREGRPYEAEWRIRRHDGAWRRMLVRGVPTPAAEGGGDLHWHGFCTEAPGVPEGGPAASLRFAEALEAVGLGLWSHDLATGRFRLHPGWRELHGLPPGPDLSAGEWLGLVHPEDRPAVEAGLRAAAGSDVPLLLRYRILRADTGALRWVETRGARLAGEDGIPGHLLGVTLDVTAQQEEAERAALLMREVDHRAKNVLATVQALLRLTRAENPEDYAEKLEGRLAVLGRAQLLLQQEQQTGAELQALLRAEFAPYAGSDTARLALLGPALVLAPAAVQPLSMAVHELVTNAAKHGALSRPGGRVTITWSLAPEGGLRLDWQEEGGPAVAAPPRRLGFGSNLLRGVVAAQLRGSIETQWAPQGLRCRILLPAAALARPGSGAAEQGMNPAVAAPLAP